MQQPSPFPTLEARSLAGTKMVYPEVLNDQISLVIMVYEEWGRYQEAQGQANQWLAVWENEWSTKGVVAHEIPMMSGGFRIAKDWIDSGMRSGIPKEKHETVSCFYGDKSKYKKILGADSYKEAQVFLLDENGFILAQTQGMPSEEKLAPIRHILSTL